jgi:hypothetical protein
VDNRLHREPPSAARCRATPKTVWTGDARQAA